MVNLVIALKVTVENDVPHETDFTDKIYGISFHFYYYNELIQIRSMQRSFNRWGALFIFKFRVNIFE